MPKTNPQSVPKKPTPAANPWLETLKTIALSAVMAIGLRQFVAESRVVPTGSMEPTIAINDRFIVDKLSYRFALPQRGDVVVFTPPAAAANCTSAATPPKDAYVKRAIGLPGDRVEVTAGQVLINGQALEENYLKALPTYEMAPVTVPAQQYLMLGDNRNNSCDGHHWGFVPQENIIGKAMVRFWPPDRMGKLNPKPPYQP